MIENIEKQLKEYELVLPGILDEKLTEIPPELKRLLAALGPQAVGALQVCLWYGPDRLGAIKLVLQLCKVLDVNRRPRLTSYRRPTLTRGSRGFVGLISAFV